VDGAALGVAVGAGRWIAILVAGLAAGLYLDRDQPGDPEPRHRVARAAGLLALSLVAAVAVVLAWGSPEDPMRPAREAAAWWAPSLVVLWLGAYSARVGGTGAMTRLAAAQAVPAILLQLAPALGWRAGGALLAGAARLGVPPLHPLQLAAADTLSLGTLLLLLVVCFVLGAPAASAGALALPWNAGVVASLLALAAGAVGAAALRDLSLSRRLAIWSSVQASLAMLVTWALTSDPESATPGGLRHAAACAAALPLLGIVFGGVMRPLRTDDLRAYGGLRSEAPWRAVLLVAAAFGATLVSAPGAGVLAAAGLAPDAEWFPRAACVGALVGWLGANLALVLAAYRMTRGSRPSPGEAVTEPTPREWAMVLLAMAFCAWTALADGFGVWPSAWTVGSAAGGEP
jgi:hypothetical protein